MHRADPLRPAASAGGSSQTLDGANPSVHRSSSDLAMTSPTFFHVDVFATSPMTGNGLTVFLDTANWSASVMQGLTREMRQFESIFLSEVSPSGAAARVFNSSAGDFNCPAVPHPS